MKATPTASAYESRVAKGTRRVIVTPEGTPLDFVIASPGDRVGAFVIDFLFKLLLVILVALAGFAIHSLSGGEGEWIRAVMLVVFFLVWNFYFLFFEARTNGRTPGKKRIGLRVMDAKGGPLTGDAIVVRNVLRLFEFDLPVTALFGPQLLWPGAPGWAVFVSILWILGIAGLPLFNRNRLRVGDIVAGTIVVIAPQARLLPDVGARAARSRPAGNTPYAFTDSMLSVYGVYELQVLERVLRRGTSGRDRSQAVDTVTEKITAKIGWTEPIPRSQRETFLREFYAALRAHQEKGLLMGRRKEDKFAD